MHLHKCDRQHKTADDRCVYHGYMCMYMYMYMCTCIITPTHPKIVVERSFLHVLHDNHDWLYACRHSIELNHIGMVELAHDGCLCQEVIA